VAEPKSAALRGKVAVVTGGSSGIGAATARLFAEKGATVVVGYHRGADRAIAPFRSSWRIPPPSGAPPKRCVKRTGAPTSW
jgi:NAD(P)-dependent dehydrogenase (short-subunit alcohol dehydrogenase family)